jgi:glyoxalase family protein
MVANQIAGIHHVTAICSDPQENIDFFTSVLGLRMVKLTVNFDDPYSYHFYYGDQQGHPGTILTFFAWPGAPLGRSGHGQIVVTSFSVSEGSLGYWADRLKQANLQLEQPVSRFDEEALEFRGPDDIALEIVAHADAASVTPWDKGPVPAAHAIRGFHSATLSEQGYERTAALLTETLGFRQVRESGNRFRFRAGGEGPGAVVDVLCVPEGAAGRIAAGSVHHMAFRTPGDEEQRAWRKQIAALGYNVTPVIDRKYFHSIYFREPGGILFEIATDPPGFTVDEPLESLASKLALPAQYEPQREQIVRRLPVVHTPAMK